MSNVPPQRVPQGVEAATQLIQGRDTMDIVILFLIPAGFVGGLYMLGLFGIIGMGVGLGAILMINAAVYRLIPAKESVSYWVKSYYKFKTSGKVLFKKGTNPTGVEDDISVEKERTGGRDITTDGGDAIDTEESTQEMTQIDEIDTYNGVIKLTSGEYISAIRVVGMERNLIDNEIKQKATQSYQSFLRTTDFPISIKCTSEQFEIDSEVEKYNDRLDDEDVEQRPILKRVMKSKRDFVDTRIRSLGMNNRKYYIFIRVDSSDQSIDDGTPFNLDFIDPDSPIGRWLMQRMGTNEEGKTPHENMTDMAVSRRRNTKRSIGQIRQCGAKPLNGQDLARVVRNFYCGGGGKVNGWEQSSPVTVTDQTAKEMQKESAKGGAA